MVFNVIFPYILIVKIVKHTTHWKKSNPFHTDLNNEGYFFSSNNWLSRDRMEFRFHWTNLTMSSRILGGGSLKHSLRKANKLFICSSKYIALPGIRLCDHSWKQQLWPKDGTLPITLGLACMSHSLMTLTWTKIFLISYSSLMSFLLYVS